MATEIISSTQVHGYFFRKFRSLNKRSLIIRLYVQTNTTINMHKKKTVGRQPCVRQASQSAGHYHTQYYSMKNGEWLANLNSFPTSNDLSKLCQTFQLMLVFVAECGLGAKDQDQIKCRYLQNKLQQCNKSRTFPGQEIRKKQ